MWIKNLITVGNVLGQWIKKLLTFSLLINGMKKLLYFVERNKNIVIWSGKFFLWDNWRIHVLEIFCELMQVVFCLNNLLEIDIFGDIWIVYRYLKWKILHYNGWYVRRNAHLHKYVQTFWVENRCSSRCTCTHVYTMYTNV